MTNPPPMTPATADEVALYADWFSRFVANVGTVIKGKDREVGLALVCLFAQGHLLLQDHPGTGKTSLAKSIANTISGDMQRIQFTPDLLPADVTGGMVLQDGDFKMQFGPIFCNVLLADEVNRASPKTQSALLEAMEERQVTVSTGTYVLDPPFVVIATQNPDEQEGTYRLPEAQLDRFLMRTSLGYPATAADEATVLASVASGMEPARVRPIRGVDGQVSSTAVVTQLIDIASRVQMHEEILHYVVAVCRSTREMSELRMGISPRGAIALMKASRAMAATQQRTFVTIDDVRAVAHAVMAHRMLLTLDAQLDDRSDEDLLEELVERALTSNQDILTNVRRG